jgi:hypothetical protein
MKKHIILIPIISLALLFPLFGDDSKNDKKYSKAKVQVGVKITDSKDNQVKVNEYRAVDEGIHPVFKADFEGYDGKYFYRLLSDYRGDLGDQKHELVFEASRVFKQKLSFDSIYHRLDHDPLTNANVISEARSAVYVDDFNPNDNYHITRSEMLSHSSFTVPNSPLKFYVDYRQETRKGEYQARTLSKCSACHIVAKTRAISNYNKDIRIGTKVKLGNSNFDYSFTNNQFRENETAPTNNYILVEHPEKSVPVFTSRIGVGDNETLSFDNISESKKNTHLLKTAIPIGENSTITAQYLNSRVDNVGSNLQWRTSSFAGAFSTRFGKKGFFNVRFQQLTIDNDSLYIDVNEPLDIAGPNKGKTYAEAYGWNLDYTRHSAMSRNVIDVDANFNYKFNKVFRFALGYEFKSVERDHYVVQKTASHTFKGKLIIKPVKQLKFVLDGKIKSISDPFANIKGGIAPYISDVAYTNPFQPTQFITWHSLREATLSNTPESISEIKARMHWGPSSKFAVNANILYRGEVNDNLAFNPGNWERSMTQWGINSWLLLSKKLPLTVSYYNYSNTYSSIFSIAAIEGCGAGLIGGMTGTLTDMMNYDIQSQTFLISLHFIASKQFSLHCNFNYNNSSAAMKDLTIDTSQLSSIPGKYPKTALYFDDFGKVANYSALDNKQMIGELGFDYAITENWTLNGALYYYFYDDLADYLFTDTSGKSYAFFAGVTWSR